jgi:hypothetical protein
MEISTGATTTDVFSASDFARASHSITRSAAASADISAERQCAAPTYES